MNKLLKIAIMFAIPLAMWFITPPEGLSVGAWRLLGFYLMAIVGLVVKPWPAPIILLLSIAGSAIFLNATKNVLSGYASTTVWLVFSAFSLSVAFVKTGLGRRIAYLLIKSLGHTTASWLCNCFIRPYYFSSNTFQHSTLWRYRVPNHELCSKSVRF